MDTEYSHSGYLKKYAGKGKKTHKRFFVLRDEALDYYSSDAMVDKKGSIAIKTILSVNPGSGSTKQNKEGFFFHIVTREKEYLLEADSVSDKRQWFDLLIQATSDTVQYLHSSYLKKYAGKGKRSQTRFFVLQEESIDYFASDSMVDKKGSIALATILSIIQDSDQHKEGNFFHIVTHEKEYILEASSHSEKRQWIDKLNKATSGMACEQLPMPSENNEPENDPTIAEETNDQGQDDVEKGFLEVEWITVMEDANENNKKRGKGIPMPNKKNPENLICRIPCQRDTTLLRLHKMIMRSTDDLRTWAQKESLFSYICRGQPIAPAQYAVFEARHFDPVLYVRGNKKEKKFNLADYQNITQDISYNFKNKANKASPDQKTGTATLESTFQKPLESNTKFSKKASSGFSSEGKVPGWEGKSESKNLPKENLLADKYFDVNRNKDVDMSGLNVYSRNAAQLFGLYLNKNGKIEDIEIIDGNLDADLPSPPTGRPPVPVKRPPRRPPVPVKRPPPRPPTSTQ